MSGTIMIQPSVTVAQAVKHFTDAAKRSLTVDVGGILVPCSAERMVTIPVERNMPQWMALCRTGCVLDLRFTLARPNAPDATAQVRTMLNALDGATRLHDAMRAMQRQMDQYLMQRLVEPTGLFALPLPILEHFTPIPTT